MAAGLAGSGVHAVRAGIDDPTLPLPSIDSRTRKMRLRAEREQPIGRDDALAIAEQVGV